MYEGGKAAAAAVREAILGPADEEPEPAADRASRKADEAWSTAGTAADQAGEAIGAAEDALSDAAADAVDSTTEAIDSAQEAVAAAEETAEEDVAEAASTVQEEAGKAVTAAKELLSEARASAFDEEEQPPKPDSEVAYDKASEAVEAAGEAAAAVGSMAYEGVTGTKTAQANAEAAAIESDLDTLDEAAARAALTGMDEFEGAGMASESVPTTFGMAREPAETSK